MTKDVDMPYEWIVNEHHLAIQAENEIIHPNASEIYSFMADEIVDGISVENPKNSFPNFRFSKVGSPIKCRVRMDAGVLVLEVYALRKNDSVSVDCINGTIIDHRIQDDEWFYLIGDCQTISERLKQARIECSGRISIQQYLALRSEENTAKHKLILFEVSDDDIKNTFSRAGESIPTQLNADLYDYQKIGFQWMQSILADGGGCILGDEMGLGKTIQVITLFLLMISQRKVPILVIAPVSLLENWKRECEKFAPSIDVYIHHGAKRTGRYLELKGHDVVIISFNTAVSDSSMLKMIDWQMIVVDEAQNIKNPYSERSKAIRDLPRNRSIAVSGTPFENHILDVWALVDFVLPGLLGDLKTFQDIYQDNEEGAKKVEPILSAIMIRRRVKDVADDLPEKVIVTQPIEMSEMEIIEYERIRTSISESCSPKTQSISIAEIQKLRMFCTHPILCNDNNFKINDPDKASVKYQRLCEILEEIVSQGEKVLVFTSYKRMFDIFREDIRKHFSIPLWCINGDTPVDERQQIVDSFNAYEGAAMMALNPRAAGTGLNITGANHVIHYNPEWNPAVEDQASARAYRRGQKKTVFVYRLYYKDTVEDLINERIARKRTIAKSLIVGNTGKEQDQRDLLKAINMSPMLQEE